MKIAVSSQNQTQVTGHLGRCQKFWIDEEEHHQREHGDDSHHGHGDHHHD